MTDSERIARLTRMRQLTHRAHEGQTRGGGVPYWVHTDGVASYVRAVIDRGGEIEPDQAADIELAAHGHDLFEDTQVTPQQIRDQFGEQVASWILGMTNEQSDADRAEYQGKIGRSPEEVRLIKCADLADNMLSVAYGLHDLGMEWTRGFFLPIASDTVATLNATRFERFPVTGRIALDVVNVGWDRLGAAVTTASGQAWAHDAWA